MDSGFGDMPVFFQVVMPLMGAAFLVIFALAITSMVRSRRVLRDAGLDPLAAGAEIAARFAKGPLASAPKSLEVRLAELEDLHRRGVISDTELATARAAALADS